MGRSYELVLSNQSIKYLQFVSSKIRENMESNDQIIEMITSITDTRYESDTIIGRKSNFAIESIRNMWCSIFAFNSRPLPQ